MSVTVTCHHRSSLTSRFCAIAGDGCKTQKEIIIQLWLVTVLGKAVHTEKPVDCKHSGTSACLVTRHAVGKALGSPMSLQLLGLSAIGTALGRVACRCCACRGRYMLDTFAHRAAHSCIRGNAGAFMLWRLFRVPGTLAALGLDVTRASRAQNARAPHAPCESLKWYCSVGTLQRLEAAMYRG